MRQRWHALAILLVACDPSPGPTVHVEQQFVVVRLAVDPATQIGEIFQTDPTLGEPFERGFADIACDGDLASLVLALDVPVTDGVGFGRGALFFASAADERDLCDGGGAVVIQPISYDGDMDPRVEGPFYVDGRTIDGRLPIGGLPTAQLEHFPRWWRFNARMSRRVEMLDGGQARVELEDAEVRAEWAAADVSRTPNMDPEIVGDDLLDAVVAAGLQPDVDTDGDGLERFADTDGDGVIDRCVDGDGSALDGVDCPTRFEIADGYDLRLRFRVQPVEVTAW